MLMTPSRPKVIASPSAANSSTLASDRPWSTLPPMATMRWWLLRASRARIAAASTPASVSTGAPSGPLAVKPLQLRKKPVVAALADDVQRRDARRRFGAGEIGARDGELQRLANAGVLLPGQRAVKQRGRLGRSALRQLLGGRQAHRRRGRAELELRQHGQRHAADLVADLDLLQRPRRRRHHRAGQRMADVAGLRIPDVRMAVGADPQAIVAERVQRRRAARIVERAQLADARLDRVARGTTPALRSRLRARRRGPADWRRRRHR